LEKSKTVRIFLRLLKFYFANLKKNAQTEAPFIFKGGCIAHAIRQLYSTPGPFQFKNECIKEIFNDRQTPPVNFSWVPCIAYL
jgi:hypothetical protein